MEQCITNNQVWPKLQRYINYLRWVIAVFLNPKLSLSFHNSVRIIGNWSRSLILSNKSRIISKLAAIFVDLDHPNPKSNNDAALYYTIAAYHNCIAAGIWVFDDLHNFVRIRSNWWQFPDLNTSAAQTTQPPWGPAGLFFLIKSPIPDYIGHRRQICVCVCVRVLV